MTDTAAPKRRLSELPYATQAALLCGDPAFHRYVAEAVGLHDIAHLHNSFAAKWLREQCRIDSRTALNTDPAARARFDQIRTTFDAWRGKIAAPR